MRVVAVASVFGALAVGAWWSVGTTVAARRAGEARTRSADEEAMGRPGHDGLPTVEQDASLPTSARDAAAGPRGVGAVDPAAAPGPAASVPPDETLADMAAWAQATDADYDAVLELVPDDAQGAAAEILQTSRDTLDKLRGAAARGEVPVSSAIGAVDHQRKVVARRLAEVVDPDVAAEIDDLLGVTSDP